jgi:hypothetical protein
MLGSVLTTLGPFHARKKEGWLLYDLSGLLNPGYAVIGLGVFLIALAVVYT